MNTSARRTSKKHDVNVLKLLRLPFLLDAYHSTTHQTLKQETCSEIP